MQSQNAAIECADSGACRGRSGLEASGVLDRKAGRCCRAAKSARTAPLVAGLSRHSLTRNYPSLEIPDIAAKSGIIRLKIPILNGSKCANEHYSGSFWQPDTVTVIDDDLRRSGSGSMQRPGFERLVAMVCSGDVGAVYCIEDSRLARNGRDWHHLIDLCAIAGALVIDPDGVYDPRLVNDRLLLGLNRKVT